MHASKHLALILPLALVAGAAVPAVAQPAAVALTVLDSGAPLAGARVSATSPGGTLLATGITDAAGRVDFRLPRGVRVRLRVAAPAGLVETAAVVGGDLPCAGKGRTGRCAGTVVVEGLKARVAAPE